MESPFRALYPLTAQSLTQARGPSPALIHHRGFLGGDFTPFRSPLRRTKKRDIEFVFFLPCLSCYPDFPRTQLIPVCSHRRSMSWHGIDVRSNQIQYTSSGKQEPAGIHKPITFQSQPSCLRPYSGTPLPHSYGGMPLGFPPSAVASRLFPSLVDSPKQESYSGKGRSFCDHLRNCSTNRSNLNHSILP